MKFISHRGNINGKMESHENEPNYIDNAIENGYDVEVDVRYTRKNGIIFLGHDKPDYGVPISWFEERIHKLWFHCKDIKTLEFFNNELGDEFNYFFHDSDDATLTSHAWLWAHPGTQPVKGSIAVLPELEDIGVDLSDCGGICSDYIKRYKDEQ